MGCGSSEAILGREACGLFFKPVAESSRQEQPRIRPQTTSGLSHLTLPGRQPGNPAVGAAQTGQHGQASTCGVPGQDAPSLLSSSVLNLLKYPLFR